MSEVAVFMLTEDQRTLRARAAAHHQHALGRTNTAPGTKAFLDRFERQVDPDGTLDPAERAKRAAHARKAWMTTLAFKSSKKRAAAATRRPSEPIRPSHDGRPGIGVRTGGAKA